MPELLEKIKNLENRLSVADSWIQILEEQLKEHKHEGIVGRQIDLPDLFGLLRTVTVAADLTAITAQPAKNIYEQIFIDTTTATKKLYVFDAPGNVWRSVAIT